MSKRTFVKVTAMLLSLVMMIPMIASTVSFATTADVAKASFADEGTEFIYEADFEDGAIITNENAGGVITVVEDPKNPDNKAMSYYMKGTSNGTVSQTYYGSRVELMTPEFSHTSYKTVAIEFDFYVEKGDVGIIALTSTRDNPAKLSGYRNGDTAITNASTNEETPELIRVDFGSNADTGTIHGGRSGSSQKATFNKGEWNTATVVIDMKLGKVKGYLNGEKVFENTLYATVWNSTDRVTQSVTNPCDLTFVKNGLSFLAPWADRAVSGDGNLLIDNFKIFDYEESKGQTIYSSDFQDSAIITNTNANGLITVVNAPGSATNKVMQYYMSGTSNGTVSSWNLYGGHYELKNPQISYATYEQIAVKFNFYVPKDHYGIINLSGSKEVGVTVNGTTKTVDEPILFRLDFSGETATIRSGSNGTTAAFSKGEWHTATAVINMKTCKIKGYLDDTLISESTLSVSGISNVQNLMIPAEGLAFIAPLGDRTVSGGGNLMIDNFEIYEFVEKINDTLVDADFNDMVIGSAGATEESVNPVQNKGQTTVVERDTANGDKAWRIPMSGGETFIYNADFEDGTVPMNLSGTGSSRITNVSASGGVGNALQFHMRGNNSGARSVYLYDDRAQEMLNPAISYTSYDFVEIEFDFYIAAGSTGCLAFGGGRDYPMKANGTLGGSAKTGVSANEETPEFCRIDFLDSTTAATFHGGRSGSSQAATINRGQWYTVSLVSDMKNCKVIGYLDGEQVFENTLYITSWNSSAKATQQLVTPVNLQIPEKGLAFYPPYEYRRTNTEGKIQIDNFKISEYKEEAEDETPSLKIPEISHSQYDKAVFDLDVFIEANSNGSFSLCYDNAAPELFRLDFAADSDTVALTSGVNGASGTATVNKGEWNRVAVVVGLKDGTMKGYLNGVEVFSTSLAGEATNLTLAENALCFIAADPTASGIGAVLIDNVKVYGMNDAALAAVTVTIPETDKNGNALNYVLYGDRIVGATELLALEKGVYTPVYFDASVYEGMITTVDAASIRLNAPTDETALRTTSGIRFATEIHDMELFDSLMDMKTKGELKDFCFGTLIAPNDYLTEDALTKELGEGRYLDVQADYGYYYSFDNDPDTTHFVGSIVDIYTANLGRRFAACGYVEVTLLSGQVITWYGGVVRRSIKQVAIKLLDDDSYTWSDTAYAQLERYSKVPSWLEEELDPTKQKMLEVVNITTGTTETEIYAGEELRSYLAMKGVFTASNGYPIELLIDESLGEDCYVIEATLGEDGKMTIRGGNGRGVLYGVYAFLEDYAGFGFYTPELEVFDDSNVIINAGVMDEYTPVFDTRRSSWYTVADSTEQLQSFYVKNRVNGNVSLEKLGGGESYAPNMFVHTIGILTETGSTYSGNPCLTDPANLEKTIENVRKILAQYPDSDIISVSQNDNTDYCQCENCAASDEKYGSPAGTMLAFVNAVADAIKDEYPNVIVDTLAYKYTQTAPVGIVPRENVCVRLCSINCHFTQPLTSTASEENVKFSNDIVAWSEICDNIYIWDYTTNYTYCLTTFPNFGVLRENMQFYADHNVKGMFPQGNGFSPSGEFGELRRYLLMRLMADPYMSEEEYYAYMDGFLEAYYGAGWQYIRAYIDKTTELASDTADMSGIYNTSFNAITRKEWEANRDDFNFYWSEAMRLAGNRLENVQKSHMQWRFVNLCLTPNQADAEAVIADAKKWGMAFREGKPYVDPSSDLNTAPWNWKYTS